MTPSKEPHAKELLGKYLINDCMIGLLWECSRNVGRVLIVGSGSLHFSNLLDLVVNYMVFLHNW